jgi:cell shape-determining protein MreC
VIPPAHARRLLPLTFVVLTLLTFTPVRWVSWLSSFGQLMQTLVAPISHPMAGVSRWLYPTGSPRDESETIRALTDNVEATKVQLLQAVAENDRLRAMIKELQRGRALDPELQVQQLVDIPVIGSSGDLADPLLTIRAGRKQGVDQTTIAMAYGLQLLGRVVQAGERTATVAPITSKASGGLTAVIMLDETDPTAGLACTLSPRGDGTLFGDVEDRRDPATNTPIEPKIGAEVRLRDPAHWPRTAQMLLVGRVESVEPSPKQPLRKVVTVRPTVKNLERVSEVVLRILPEQDAADSRPAAPAKGDRR